MNHVYVFDQATGKASIVSTCGCGGKVTLGNGLSKEPAISADGSVVAFTSWATNLMPDLEDTNESTDVFVQLYASQPSPLNHAIFLPLLSQGNE